MTKKKKLEDPEFRGQNIWHVEVADTFFDDNITQTKNKTCL